MSKLTLSVDKSVVTQARQYAKQKGISVSQMVETYLAAVASPPEKGADPPVLRALRGKLKRADIEDYRKHLVAKHR